MSKVSEAKKSQGYIDKPVRPVCMNCNHFVSKIETRSGYFSEYTHESEKRCGLGGFAVKKTATCMWWEIKQ